MRLELVGGLMLMVACAATREQQQEKDAGVDAGKPRIRLAPDAGGTCDVCGDSVAVVTELPRLTPLTAEECDDLCDSVWCGYRAHARPGCDLLIQGRVSCGPSAADCGVCDFNSCHLDTCLGCCDGFFACTCSAQPVAAYCRHRPCFYCPVADTRCELESCRNFKACGGKLRDEPDPTTCADADGGIDPNFELATLCPDACNVMQAGAVVEAGCADAGVAADAGTAADAGSDSCRAACQSSRATCESACTRESFGACMNCAANCGFDDAYCVRACN